MKMGQQELIELPGYKEGYFIIIFFYLIRLEWPPLDI